MKKIKPRKENKSRNISCNKCGVSFETNSSRTKRCIICRKLGWKLYTKTKTWEKSEKGITYMKKFHLNNRMLYKKQVFDYYGWYCNCCNEKLKTMLTIDHVNNDGYLDRRAKISGVTMYKKIINNNFPNSYQVLCMNCNWSKKINKGICEHKMK